MSMSQGEPAKPRVLVVEDSPDLALLVQSKLRTAGFDVRIESDGLQALSAARQGGFAVVVLDKGLPSLGGLEICRRLRETSDVPIVMLTADGDIDHRIEGLNAGANDYLPKPFDAGELVARVQAQLRAYRPAVRKRLAVSDLALDPETREVWRGDMPVTLTAKEFDLLHCLISHANQVMSRESLLETVWGYDFEGEDNVLDVFIRRLRNKIERPGAHKLLHTTRGVGYMLRESAP